MQVGDFNKTGQGARKVAQIAAHATQIDAFVSNRYVACICISDHLKTTWQVADACR
jgi:hypothetical protein